MACAGNEGVTAEAIAQRRVIRRLLSDAADLVERVLGRLFLSIFSLA